MKAQVYIYPKIERQLADMMRQSNGRADTPAIAAQRARQIIDKLIQGISPAGCGLMKSHKDTRIKNCLKFNIGSGFRLICIKERPDIHIMFAGDHDNCDAWLDHYAQKKPHKMIFGADVFKIAPPVAVHVNEKKLPDMTPGFDDSAFLSDISQEDLRRVFSGLCTPG